MFKWLNKQGVESDEGFVVQFTSRFTCEYRENGRIIELQIESGVEGGLPCICIKKDAFSEWEIARTFQGTSDQVQARLMSNLRAAFEFQGLLLVSS